MSSNIKVAECGCKYHCNYVHNCSNCGTNTEYDITCTPDEPCNDESYDIYDYYVYCELHNCSKENKKDAKSKQIAIYKLQIEKLMNKIKAIEFEIAEDDKNMEKENVKFDEFVEECKKIKRNMKTSFDNAAKKYFGSWM